MSQQHWSQCPYQRYFARCQGEKVPPNWQSFSKYSEDDNQDLDLGSTDTSKYEFTSDMDEDIDGEFIIDSTGSLQSSSSTNTSAYTTPSTSPTLSQKQKVSENQKDNTIIPPLILKNKYQKTLSKVNSTTNSDKKTMLKLSVSTAV